MSLIANENTDSAVREGALYPFAWSPRPGAQMLTLPEQIAEKVGSAIIQGKLRPGQRIQEQEVADNFGVSRGPVREALRVLERFGLVQINARRGAQVTQLTAKEINDVFNIRISLMGLAARLAAESATPDGLRELRLRIEQLPELARRKDVDSYLASIYALNWLLPNATGNRFLRDTLFSLVYLSLRYGRLGLTTEKSRLESAKSWNILLELIEKKKAREAQKFAEGLIGASRARALDLIAKQQHQQVADEASSGSMPSMIR